MEQYPKIGAFVLETLTTGMYLKPLDSLREYIQNSVDSILSAEKIGILSEMEGRIEIIVNPDKRDISIKDTGIGIPKEKVIEYLINIGMSDKKIEVDAGFRGIGRLAGISYCDKIRFETSFRGENSISIVEINCKNIREAVSPLIRQKEEIQNILSKNIKITFDNFSKENHFFEVIMENISDAASDFLDWQILEKYLAQVVPVDYDAHRFYYSTKIYQWIQKNNFYLPTVALVIKVPQDSIERQIFKPYKTNYKTKKTKAGEFPVKINDIRFYRDNNNYWLWYSDTALLGMIDDNSVAGLRLRKNNIALGGPENVAELFGETGESNKRFNAYYIGEIHILSTDAIPNARRDGFEERNSWPEIKRSLISFINDRCKDVRLASDVRNRPLEKIKSSARKIIDDAEERLENGLVSVQERDKILNKVKNEQELIQKAYDTRKGTDESDQIIPIINKLDKIIKRLEDENNWAVKKILPTLDRKQRKILREVLSIVHDRFQNEKCNKNEECYKVTRKAILDRFKVNEREIN